MSWNYVEYSKRKGIILKYEYSCKNAEVSILKTVENSIFQATVQNLKPDTMYTCTVAACTKVGCGVNSSVSNKSKANYVFTFFSFFKTLCYYAKYAFIAVLTMLAFFVIFAILVFFVVFLKKLP